MLEKAKAFFLKIKEQLARAYLSLTLWFNTSGLLLLQIGMDEPLVLQYLTEKDLLIIILLGNAILRFKTTKALEDK